MRSLWVLVLLLAVAAGERDFTIKKCCGASEMLSGDGRRCVAAPPLPNLTLHQRFVSSFGIKCHCVFPPYDARWVQRWLPPGLPLRRLGEVHLNSINEISHWVVRAVEASTEWDWGQQKEKEADSYPRGRVVFSDVERSIIRTEQPSTHPEHYGFSFGLPTSYCVDAAQPPLAPFALLMETACGLDDCLDKCCASRQVVAAEGGGWKCVDDAKGDWSPDTSAFAHLIPPHTPFNNWPWTSCVSSSFVPPHTVHLSPGDASRAAHLLSGRFHDFRFSTWNTCVDYERLENKTLRETIFVCEHTRITRGVYWMLRPLSWISCTLLVAALASVACNSRMRHKTHGWCLACHAACLLAFNIGQVVYTQTLSDEVDAYGYVPLHLKNTCEIFALPMYFVLAAANSWLTALCTNMALGFSTVQVARRGGGGGRRRFAALSAFAWGLPIALTAGCASAFTTDYKARRWFSTSLAETRTCFNEAVEILESRGGVSLGRMSPSLKSGTALFYYGPVGALVVANAICVARTLRKVQFLRRGNSVLRREEEQGCRGQRRPEGEASAVDASSIRTYIKMLLMTGVVEVVAEISGWATSAYSKGPYSIQDHALTYRATGYVSDLFRAACVAWLAAPEGGYVAAYRKWRKGRKAKGARRAERP